MGIRSALTKALAQTAVPYELTNGNGLETKSIPTVSIPFWPDFHGSGFGVRTEASVTRYTAYYASALAFICMNYRAQKLQEPPLMVVEETDDGEEWIPSPIDPILARPNADYPMRRMLVLTSLFRDITGTALWLKVKDRGTVTKRMYAFSGEEFTVESTEERLFGKFRITTRNGQIDAGPEDVVFFPGVDPWNPLGAISLLHVALTELGVSSTLQDATKTALRHAVRPGGAISVPEVLSDDEFNFVVDPFMSEIYPEDETEPAWWCLPCYSESADDI